MKINKNSLHYKVYVSTYLPDTDIPWRTNLCQYVRRILLSPIFWLKVLCTLALFLIIFIIEAGWNVVMIGKRPKKFDIGNSDNYVDYPLPKVGIKICPIYIIILTMLVYGYFYSPRVHAAYFTYTPLAVKIIGVIGIIILLIIGVAYFFDSSTWKLWKKYLKAKKRGICPRIEFE